MSGPPIARGAVMVSDGRITEVGPAAELRARTEGTKVLTYPGCALLPGLVNVHTHLEYSAFRDFSRPCGFGEWMLRLLLARRKLKPEDYGVSALWGAQDCVRGGVTCIADTSFEGWTSARAAGAAGLRARVYLEVVGLDDAELPVTMRRTETRLAELRRNCSHLVEPGLSPHAPYTVSARLYRELARYANRERLRLATHVAESEAEVELLRHGTGAIAYAYRMARLWKGQRWSPPRLSPTDYVGRAGVLGPTTLAVHCIQVEDGDIQALACSGTAVAHCPRSNRRLQCGIAPVAELLGAGVTVGLGTDSLASNDNLDMFAEMRAALAMSRARASSVGGAQGEAFTEAQVLRMATLEGARALGLDSAIGSLDCGKSADMIAVRLPDIRSLGDVGPDLEAGRLGERDLSVPRVSATDSGVGNSDGEGPDPIRALISGATAADVQMTMVNGSIVFSRDRARTAEFDEATQDLKAVREKLGLEG